MRLNKESVWRGEILDRKQLFSVFLFLTYVSQVTDKYSLKQRIIKTAVLFKTKNGVREIF